MILHVDVYVYYVFVLLIMVMAIQQRQDVFKKERKHLYSR